MTYRLLLLSVLLCLAACHFPDEGSVRTSREPGPEELRTAYARPPAAWPAPTLDSGVVHRELAILRREQAVPPPAEYARLLNGQVRDERQLADLGKALFFDPRLSASNQVSCASCHDPDLAWGDGRRRSFGHDRSRGLRNAPTLLNAGHWTSLFWDGRATTLEEQVLGPLQDSLEMGQNLAGLAAKLDGVKAYRKQFGQVFMDDEISNEKIVAALTAFERRLRSRTNRLDHFMNGSYDALSDAEIRGLHLFRTKARCLNCHNGPLLSDQEFHNQGTHLLGRPEEDLGRYLVTGDWADAGAFRTPSLRDIFFTGPYFHHGNVVELREVLQLYNAGMPQVIPRNVRKRVDRLPLPDPLLQPLGLTEGEIDDLLAFLQSVSTRPRAIRVPEMVK